MNDRLETVDSKDYETFANSYGGSLDANWNQWVRLVISDGATEKSFRRLNTLAWFIFVERQGAVFGEPKRFTVSPTACIFQEFVYRLNVFQTMRVPFEEWSSMFELLHSTLLEIVDSDCIDFESDSCEAVEVHAHQLLSQLRSNAAYNERFYDFLNGAL